MRTKLEKTQRRPSPSEASFSLAWDAYAPAFPLACDPVSLKLPYQDSGRRFQADFCHIQSKVAIEVQGGTWNGGKHGRGAGIQIDALKLAIANSSGWLVFQICSGQEREIMPLILNAIIDRGGQPVPVKTKTFHSQKYVPSPF